jgi:predicted  nucleic acid-binding Zn-ribbon protein
MPHQCTNCGRGFEDGSKEMLSGCPNCGGNKFQFQPADASTNPTPDAEPPDPPEPADSTVAKTVGKTASTVRNLVGTNDSPQIGANETDEPEIDSDESDTAIDANATDTEDAAQASARGDVISPDELPPSAQSDDAEHEFDPIDTPDQSPSEVEDDTDSPDLKDLRQELNEQFESIKVVEPGQYELNLMELYDREEYIVALEEDGHYSIQVPETIGK